MTLAAAAKIFNCNGKFPVDAHAHGRQQGKGQGPNTSSHGIWNWWRHTQFHCKTLKFSLAPSALALNTLKFSLRHLKFAKVSTFCRPCAKNRRFCYSGLQIPSILFKKMNICKNFRLLILTRKNNTKYFGWKFPGDVHASAEGACRNFGVPPPFRPLLRPWPNLMCFGNVVINTLCVVID